MTRSISRRLSYSLLASLAVVPLTTIGDASHPATPPPMQAQDVSGARGQSATLLPDGRWLLIGGEDGRASVSVRNPDTGAVTALGTSLGIPRAWHTATLLADGSVLVLGGVDASGRTISAPERFVPATRSFEPLPAVGLAERARHTATTLSDGRVLIVGGRPDGALDDAEIWDPRDEVAKPLGSTTVVPRRGHTARLLADGRVLITGADQPQGDPVPAEVFDPSSGAFETVSATLRDPREPVVAATHPEDGASAVPADVRLAVRFSREAAVRSITTASIVLEGPDGPVVTNVVPVEAGRLVFVTPLEPLRPSSEYRLRIDGATGADGALIRPVIVTFKTAEDPADRRANVADDEEIWTPDPSRGHREWRSEAGGSPWQGLPPLQAPAGVTALAGQTLRLDGRPLADVTLRIDGHTARTDRTGRFLLVLPGVSAGRHELEMDGSTAGHPGRTYGFFEAGLTIVAGQTNVLPYTIWMPRIDTVHRVPIPSPTTGEVVVTTPRIPGLELHLPPNTVIRDHNRQIVRELSITPIPVDRPPFPLPPGVEVPIYFTIQPGGAYVYTASGSGPRGARLIYPNYHHTATGVIANFWHYDPEDKGWYVYGAGVVKGRQVVPNPGVAIYAFTGAMINTGNTPPGSGPPPGGDPPCCDPVDVATGLLIVEKTDLVLPDVLPLALRRTYRPADPAVRPFGIGTTHDYAIFLWSAQQFQEVDLVLPDGGRVHYLRTSPGTGFEDAQFEHTASPTAFYKSRITWNGTGWDLTLKDGTVFVFGMQAPLQAIRDRFGNSVRLSYSGTGAFGHGIGNLTRVESPNGRWMELSYDGTNRVIQARDNIGRAVGYQYDASGRLWKVTDAAGGVTEYTYDPSHRLRTITDARGIVFLTNEYDTNGRVIRQTLADSTTFEIAYTVDQNGKVTQGDVTDPRGNVTRTTFNAAGYALTTVEAVGTSLQRSTTVVRNSPSNLIASVTDPLNRRTDSTYDPSGNLTTLTQLAGTADAVTTELDVRAHVSSNCQRHGSAHPHRHVYVRPAGPSDNAHRPAQPSDDVHVQRGRSGADGEQSPQRDRAGGL